MPTNTNAGHDRVITEADRLSGTVSETISGLVSIINELDTMIDERDGTIESLNETIRELTAEIEILKEAKP
jgi:hypothetical protein